MSRRGGSVYEERERDYYSREGPPPARVQTRGRDYEEVDTYIRREREPERGSRPEFLREDYGRPDPGPLVVRERDTEVFTTRPLERRPRSPSPVRVVRETRERIIERSPSPPPERVRTTRIIERERRSPSPPPPERLRARVIETRERVRERTPSPPPVRVREVYREREIREPSRERSQERIRVRNIERESVRAPSPSPSPSPSPPPIRAPPIHQEIITHHRHIDHGNYQSSPIPRIY
jgi:hypothetical protein